MSHNTIDYGIDLGTTNSSIAYINPGSEPRVIDNVDNERITPSAVHISKSRSIRVGKRAYNQTASIRPEEQDNVYIEFKRRMGTDDTYHSPRAGRAFLPEELSAKVLKDLRASVENKRREKIDAAVITIPAAFEQPQIAATKRAAELVGFHSCELLQEPVAAALAYGFLESDVKGYWIVYDMGGGTFDVALLQLRDGLVRIANHFGDNYLGGKDIDNLIMDRIILPRIEEELGLDNFNRGEKRWKYACARIRYFVEQAKMLLSRSETAELYDVGQIYDPVEGKNINIDTSEYELGRDEINPLVESIITRSTNYIKDLLKQSHLNRDDIEKIILVGGPTHYYLFRDALETEFGIPLEFSLDPMTVVSLGAAIFAGTRRKATRKVQPIKAGMIRIDLTYEPSGADNEPDIGGIVQVPKGRSADQYSIELIHTRTEWRSGKVQLAENGAFVIAAWAEKGGNEYRIELTDSEGSLCKITPETLSYTLIGIEAPTKTLIHNISISQADGSVKVIFKKGDALPLHSGIIRCEADHLIKKGSEDSLRIKIFEGNNTRYAKRNNMIGEVVVPSTEFPRDLQARSEIEVNIQLDENGSFTGSAEVLIFDMDEPYSITWHKEDIYGVVDLNQLTDGVEAIRSRLTELRPLVKRDSHAADIFARINAEDTEQQIADALQAACNDPDQASKCQKLIMNLNERLDEVDTRQERPVLEKKARQALEAGEQLMQEAVSRDYVDQYDTLRQEVEVALTYSDNHLLIQSTEHLESLIHFILSQSPEYWIKGLQFAEGHRDVMTDQNKAQILFSQGRKAIDAQDLESLKSAVSQLIGLLPSEVQYEAEEAGNIWVIG